MIKKLDKSTYDAHRALECNKGQRVLLSSHGASSRCPSLHLSFEEARQRLLDRGMSKEDFEGLMGFLRGLAQGLIDEEIRAITSSRDNNGYE